MLQQLLSNLQWNHHDIVLVNPLFVWLKRLPLLLLGIEQKSTYLGMAAFRYRHTFIDEQSTGGVLISRCQSWPQLGSQGHAGTQDEFEVGAANYVVQLEGKRISTFGIFGVQRPQPERELQLHQLTAQEAALETPEVKKTALLAIASNPGQPGTSSFVPAPMHPLG